VETLYIRNGSEFRTATEEEIIARAQALISKRFCKGCIPLRTPRLMEAYLRLHLSMLDYEVFGVLHLDVRHCLIAAENVFRGSMTSCPVDIREIAQSVLQHRTSAVILYHNHPSGTAKPSEADEAITWRIRDVLKLIDVTTLDHLIIGETVFSFAKEGLL
jgi:DNA repair protein RadC